MSQVLNRPVRTLNKVGPKFEKLLEKLEIKTIGDLLYHFPFRYDDYSKKVSIKDAQIGETVSITGYLGKITNIVTHTGKRATISSVTDGSGVMNLLWFNQHYLKTSLKENGTYTFSGRIAEYKNKKCMFSPEVEAGDGGVSTARLVSIYPETAGISSKWLRSRNNDVVKLYNQNDLPDFLPQELINKYGYPNLYDALNQIHFPSNATDAVIAKNRFAFEEIFLELIKVEKRKQEWKKEKNGCKILYEPYQENTEKLISGLPFKLTTSQQKALDDIFIDLRDDTPMNRLLEGDVGSGKTIVSLIAAYVAHLNGYKTVVMAPTEILAHQHYETFTRYLNLNIVKRTNVSKADLSDDFDIVIGTHALLYSQTPIAKLGLVVIDEQHRFGVEQRTQLINMSKENLVPNLLSMTATPIPRTLSLTIYGDLDISLLQPHMDRSRNITTKIATESNRVKLYEWVKAQNQQTFIVCPFIEQSENEDFANVKAAEKEFRDLQKILPPNLMRLIHGRMKPKEKQSAIEEFRTGKIKYLVSTPVIEVGIDVPEASIMVIESAERYGLASLHQLRGRVGRTGQRGYCFLVYSGTSQKSRERLKYMETCSNGLELAEMDLKMRGQGDIFGTMQSGIKNFKVASIFDIELLEKAKTEAQRYLLQLDKIELLRNKLDESGKYIGQN